MGTKIDDLSKLLSHPFSLLIVGAIISSLIIPYYTKSWQDYQKELEIKSTIISSISKAMSDYVINGRLVQIPGFMDKIDYTQSTIDWEISKSVIKSQIQTYFNDSTIIKNWEDLSFALTEFVSLDSGLSKKNSDFANKLCIRIKHIMNVYEYLNSKNSEFAIKNPLNINFTEYTNCEYVYDKKYSNKYFVYKLGYINWNILVHKELLVDFSKQREYLSNWIILEKMFDNEKNVLSQIILKTPIFVS
ncbi:MAG: hypothetical protein ACM3XP_02995 [Nitrososphaerales archaeon]